MLLDDVMSELDARRRAQLAKRLAEGGQAVLTATEPDHLPGGCERTELALRRGEAIASPAGAAAARGARLRRVSVRGSAAPARPPRCARARTHAEPLTLLAAAQSAWAAAAGARDRRPKPSRWRSGTAW